MIFFFQDIFVEYVLIIFKIYILNIIHVFTDTFDQFNAFLLVK